MPESLEVVTFPGGHTARLARVADPAGLPAALSGMGLNPPRPALVLVGGAAGLDLEYETTKTLDVLFRAMAQAVGDAKGVVVDGGTASGVMRLMGQARAALGATFPLVGVAAEGTVALPGQKGMPLEPHHTHFILVPGNQWGDESPWIAQAATVLTGGVPSLTLLVNGGDVSRQDVALSMATGRPVLVVAGTGRLADELAAGEECSPLLSVVGLTARPSELRTALRSLFKHPRKE
jgi:hypothetical protein